MPTVHLQTAAGVLSLPYAAASESQLLKNLVEDSGMMETDDIPIPIPPSYSPESVATAVRFLQTPAEQRQSREFRTTFLKDVAPIPKAMTELLQTANYLEIRDLLAFAETVFVDTYLRGKSSQAVLAAFGLPKDTVFSEEEKQEIRLACPWLRQN
eukprot:m.5308 g.5308  ORF g.5308 m.5308 type:complete len:155 (+) comp4498_c0_seq1:39-503(+)